MPNSDVDGLDFEWLKALLVNKHGTPFKRADDSISRYRDFLKLAKKYPEHTLVPDCDIDAAWHAHISHTRRYEEDMASLFGQMFHHDPTYFGTQEWEDDWQRTRELFKQEFGYSLGRAVSCGGGMDASPAACGGGM